MVKAYISKIVTFLLLLFVFAYARPVFAISDPAGVPNNKYGIHIADFNDIPDVPALVNSSGGDWGYITLVSTDSDRDRGVWQRLFDEMRRLHVIPIVRLATHVENAAWVKPNPGQFDEIVSFFNSLNWPVQNRYIILYNEPNHANEWGGTIDPEGYADDLVTLGGKFKHTSNDFFVLPAGLDASAGTNSESLDSFAYLKRMVTAKPELLSVIDGWTSHSYPNPGFSGSPYASGRGSLGTYSVELSLLQTLGLTKQLPVFITETGWTHSQGKTLHTNYLSPEAVGQNLVIASQSVWTDSRIVAITPFVFNYQDTPFDNFSWKQLGSNTFYAQYDAYRNIPKTAGHPMQTESYKLSSALLPKSLVANSTYTLSTVITNQGEGILNPSDDYSLLFYDEKQGFSVIADPLPTLEPGEKGIVTLHIKTPYVAGEYPVKLSFVHDGRQIPLESRTISIVPPPSIRVYTQLGWRRSSNAEDVSVIVYDGATIIHKLTGLSIQNGEVTANGLANIIPDKEYRVVVLVPYYLPRQMVIALGPQETTIHMKRFYPLDIDGDGKFTLSDVWSLLTSPPKNMLQLFVGS
ncbi:MAG TPA: hypothetical protein VMR81_01675 [Patescibacteria group bacterium]|nr:hypothetical protein [Patescibacteria group bacterium]